MQGSTMHRKTCLKGTLQGKLLQQHGQHKHQTTQTQVASGHKHPTQSPLRTIVWSSLYIGAEMATAVQPANGQFLPLH